METWLSHPAVQAVGLPFIVALIVALPLARTRWLAIAQVAGFAVCATLVAGWSLEALTSTRKLAIIGIATLALCALVEVGSSNWRAAAATSAVALGFAAAWMLWRLLAQKEIGPALLAALLAAGYVVLQAGLSLHAGADPVRSTAAGAVLALATGAVAILGASAVLGSMAIAVGVSAVATLVLPWLRNEAPPRGRSIALPVSAVAALGDVAAVLVAELPGYCLVPLALVFPVSHLAPALRPVRTRAAVAFALALIPAAAAIALAWFRPA
ncbi:MAG TPA: hypothetical protein VMZ74_03215 [Ramlibacter sp.]|nr:hypothetical protein [Ramlibacter sp.]